MVGNLPYVQNIFWKFDYCCRRSITFRSEARAADQLTRNRWGGVCTIHFVQLVRKPAAGAQGFEKVHFAPKKPSVNVSHIYGIAPFKW